MKKFILSAIAAISFVGFANAEVLTGNFNTGRDEESDNSSSLDVRFHACDDNADLTCMSVIRSVAADGSTNEGVMSPPTKNFDPNNGADFELTGALVLKNLRYVGLKDGQHRWEGGLFYNAATNKEFNGVFVQTRDDGGLDVGGCVLIFCQTSTFTALN